ncbi:hypothetical protein FACS1894208_12250 [Clostridia bacterium]|nr:hypothetical protein FACS1894208_12250 [Clostridia bacterium]
MINNGYTILRGICTAEELGRYYLGNEHQRVVPAKRRIDRAEYGRKLAVVQGGKFTPQGYVVPNKHEGYVSGA